MSGARVLVIDDETAILDTLRILLRGDGFEVSTAASGREGLAALDEIAPDFVLTDIRMPGVSGIEILAAARQLDPPVPVILMTAQASLQSAIQAVNQGAFHYIQKPFANEELLVICRRAAEAHRLRRENQALKREIRRRTTAEAIRPIGHSRSFREVIRLAEIVAPTDSTVLISGESGTGKEVVARYIHALSDRAAGPFISINCGALPENLLESELFGHIKGAFTGAIRDREGLLVAAGGGSFFLDEVGEMAPATQVKLLRALQEREVVPVGATEPIPVDVRLIAATHRDLEEEIRRGAFRTDLYYRLNVITLHLPPLRERADDIPILAEHLLERFVRSRSRAPQHLSAAASALLQKYDWPGNVRELENALERAAILTPGGEIGPDAFPARLIGPRAHPLVSDQPHPNPTLETIERAYIHWILEAEAGNKTRAAERLGIDPSTLYRKLQRYGIQG